MVKKRNMKIVKKSDTAVARQTSDHNINSNKTPNKVTQPATPITSLPMDVKEVDLYGASPPRRMKLQPELVKESRQISATSQDVEEETEERQQARATLLQSLDIDREFFNGLPTDIQEELTQQAVRERRRLERRDPEIENFDNPFTPHRASVHAKFEPNGHGPSTISSSSSGATPQFTPSASVESFEGNLIDLNADFYPSHSNNNTLFNEGFFPSIANDNTLFNGELFPSHVNDNTSFNLHNHRTSTSPLINPNLSIHRKVAVPSRQVHQSQSSTGLHKSKITIPKHELFLHNLPSKDASVVQVRAWISSWFAGRDIPFEVLWKGTDIGLQDYIDCISWSGDDLHNTGVSGLENDLRGWMLGGYAKPIVRDIGKALNMESDKKCKAISKSAVNFLYGGLFMALVGCVLVSMMLCSSGN